MDKSFNSQIEKKIQDKVAQLHAKYQFCAPPFDIMPVVLGEGVRIIVCQIHTEGYWIRTRFGFQILINKEFPIPEKRAFVTAHEFGEILFHQEMEDREGLHQCGHEFAHEFFMPAARFAQDCLAFDFDLFRLKQRYTNCSHQTLAIRCRLFSSPEVMMTMIDNGEVRSRYQGHQSISLPLSPEEKSLEQKTRQERRAYLDQRVAGMRIRAWRLVSESGWERIFLRKERG